MDPNATLAQLRELVRLVNTNDVHADQSLNYDFAELVEALDGWLSNGGYLPDAWAR